MIMPEEGIRSDTVRWKRNGNSFGASETLSGAFHFRMLEFLEDGDNYEDLEDGRISGPRQETELSRW
jgi:hypothetical protein